jgi:hypothetical protein
MTVTRRPDRAMAAGIMTVRRPRNVSSFLALAALMAGCEEQELTSTGIVHPTLIEVSPSDFLAEVPCELGPGSMQLYVATLHDHGPDLSGETPSDERPDAGQGGEGGGGGTSSDPELGFPRRSNPVSCGTAVGFAQVTAGHRYSVDIQGFDRAGLVVHEPGVEATFDAPPPPVRDIATGEPVAARWTTSCAKGTARSSLVRRLRDCAPIVDAQPNTLTAVELRPDLALGSTTCGAGAGDVDHFEVTSASGSHTLTCGEGLRIEDVVAGRTLVLGVLAFASGDADATLGATCTAIPTAGVTVTAHCGPFTDKGALDVDPAAAAAALGLSCDTLRELTVTAPGAAPIRVRPSACGSLVPLVGLPRGTQSVEIVAIPADGAAEVPGTCTATVIPSQRALATCAMRP